MIKNTFVCDNCKSEHNMENGSLTDGEQLVAIELYMDFGASRIESHRRIVSLKQSAVWCRTCVMKHGLSEPKTNKDKEVAPAMPPTFETLFADLIERLGFERRE